MQQATYFSDNMVQVISDQVNLWGRTYDPKDIDSASVVSTSPPSNWFGWGFVIASAIGGTIVSLAVNSMPWEPSTYAIHNMLSQLSSWVFAVMILFGFAVRFIGYKYYGTYIRLEGRFGREDVPLPLVPGKLPYIYSRRISRAINKAIQQRSTQSIGTPAQ